MEKNQKAFQYNRIKAVLAEKGMTARQLADALGMREQSVSRWLRNVRQPSFETLFVIARIINVNPRTLITSVEDWSKMDYPLP